jgi:2'-5' RNA ligase
METAAKQKQVLGTIEDGMTLKELKEKSDERVHITLQCLRNLVERNLVEIKGGMDEEGNVIKEIYLK